MSNCLVCGGCETLLTPQEKVCRSCKAAYPAPLIKASCGQGKAFALGLPNGKMFVFSHAHIQSAAGWLFLERDGEQVPKNVAQSAAVDARRGVYVRLNEIMWCLEGEARQCQ